MEFKKIIIGLIITLFVSDSEALTVDEAVNYALNNSESVLINLNNSEMLKARAEQSISFVKPQMSLNGTAVKLRGNTTGDSFEENYSVGANISQVFLPVGEYGKVLSSRII